MKHDLSITILLVAFFLASQYAGLFITSQYVSVEEYVDLETGEVKHNVTNVSDLPLGIERVEISQDFSWLYIMIAVLVGTMIVLLLVKFKQRKVWKGWYFFSLVFIITFALAPFDPFGGTAAFVVSIILAFFKAFRSNFFVHNITEIFLYGGLAAMLVPIMNVFSAFVLLIAISIYDAIAVWQSKHMIKLAEFQSDSNVFAGLFVPYKSANGSSKVMMKAPQANKISKKEPSEERLDSKREKNKGEVRVSRAILGGGDIAFPLLFTGALMQSVGFLRAAVVPPFVALALFGLLYFSKKGKFYPAMPFISVGCIVGYLVVILL